MVLMWVCPLVSTAKGQGTGDLKRRGYFKTARRWFKCGMETSRAFHLKRSRVNKWIILKRIITTTTMDIWYWQRTIWQEKQRSRFSRIILKRIITTTTTTTDIWYWKRTIWQQQRSRFPRIILKRIITTTTMDNVHWTYDIGKGLSGKKNKDLGSQE